MLKQLKTPQAAATKGRFAIVAAKYNAHYVDSMLNGAEATLKAAGAKEVEIVRVPGAYEIPLVAAVLAGRANHRFDAIICLGLILQGKTAHANHIGEAITMALTQIQLDYHIPVIHAVLLVNKEADAKLRCLDPKFNKGIEAAHAAIEMAGVMSGLGGCDCH